MKRNIPGEIPPPKYDDYKQAIDQVCNEEHINDGESLLNTISRKRAHDTDYNYYVHHVSPMVAVAIEPVDRSSRMPMDESMSTSHAIVRGMAFGRLFVPYAHDSSVYLGDLTPALPDVLHHIENVHERNESVGRFFVDCGEKGVEVMGTEAANVLGSFEEQVIEDVRAQRFFRTGCGIVAYTALRAHALYNQDPEFASFQAKFDKGDVPQWDDELRGLLDT